MFFSAFPLITFLVGLGRVELPTSPLSGVRSNQLSYRPAPAYCEQLIGSGIQFLHRMLKSRLTLFTGGDRATNYNLGLEFLLRLVSQN